MSEAFGRGSKSGSVRVESHNAIQPVCRLTQQLGDEDAVRALNRSGDLSSGP